MVYTGGGIAHKRGVYGTLDRLFQYFRGFKRVTQLPLEGCFALLVGIYTTHAPDVLSTSTDVPTSPFDVS